MEDIGIFIAILLALLAVLAFLYLFGLWLFAGIVEPAYVLVFNRPIYVHLYLRKQALDERQLSLLRSYSHFYRNLPPVRQRYFEHRVNRFLVKYGIFGRRGLVVTEEMRVRLAASYIALTFGMRNYLIDEMENIILYPEPFESPSSGGWHKGEYNPAVRAVVFSWPDFVEGCDIESDNLNLGIHEFAHVLYAHCRRDRDASAVIFFDAYNEILEGLREPGAMDRVRESGYFRDYAFTNPFEFLSVMLEHFFETPAELRMRFPALYRKISIMLNYTLPD